MLKLEKEITDNDIKEALSLKCSNCYAAMSFANALGGSKTIPWEICHNFKLSEIINEAKARNINLLGLMTSVESVPVVDSMYYRRATGIITEEQFQEEFRRWKNG